MKLPEYIKQNRGALARIAAAIDVSHSYMSQMAHGSRPISTDRCVVIEAATDKAVTRQEMRPHDFWKHWPDLAAPSPESVNV